MLPCMVKGSSASVPVPTKVVGVLVRNSIICVGSES